MNQRQTHFTLMDLKHPEPNLSTCQSGFGGVLVVGTEAIQIPLFDP